MSLRRFTVASRVFFISFFVPTELVGDQLPRIVERQQHARDMDAPLAAQVAEVRLLIILLATNNGSGSTRCEPLRRGRT